MRLCHGTTNLAWQAQGTDTCAWQNTIFLQGKAHLCCWWTTGSCRTGGQTRRGAPAWFLLPTWRCRLPLPPVTCTQLHVSTACGPVSQFRHLPATQRAGVKTSSTFQAAACPEGPGCARTAEKVPRCCSMRPFTTRSCARPSALWMRCTADCMVLRTPCPTWPSDMMHRSHPHQPWRLHRCNPFMHA